MSITFKRVIERKYTIASPVFGIGVSLEKFISKLKIMNMEYHEFDKCFKCDTKLNPKDEMQVASIAGVGNRCFCPECAKWINEEWDKCTQEKQIEVW